MAKQKEQESALVAHARREMEFMGLFDEDADYNGEIAKAVIDLMTLFASQGHSGFSASLTASLWYTLAQWKTLYPITNDPEEWMEVTESMYPEEKIKAGDRIWQSRRSPSIFSKDGGKTWENMDEKTNGVSMTREEALHAIGKKEEDLQRSASGNTGKAKAKDDGGVSTQPSTQQGGASQGGDQKESGSLERGKQPVANTEQSNSPQAAPGSSRKSKARKKSKKNRPAGGQS